MTAILLCPGALDSDDDRPGLVPPVARAFLGGVLRRAQCVIEAAPAVPDERELAHETWLRAALGVASADAVGAYAACASGEVPAPQSGWVVRPVHLHLGMDHVVLAPPLALTLSATEAQALLATANELLGGEGVRLVGAAGGCWRLLCESPLVLRTCSSERASRRDVFTFMPQGEDARRWRRLHNEIQMGWHRHPVNVAREERGEDPVNGIWIEGCTGPLAASTRFSHVCAQTPVLAGLAHAAGIALTVQTPGEAPHAALADALTGAAETLIELALWRQDAVAWNPQRHELGWQELEAIVGAALRTAPRSARLEIVLTGQFRVATLRWSGADRWKFWRRLDPGLLDPAAPAPA